MVVVMITRARAGGRPSPALSPYEAPLERIRELARDLVQELTGDVLPHEPGRDLIGEAPALEEDLGGRVPAPSAALQGLRNPPLADADQLAQSVVERGGGRRGVAGEVRGLIGL